MKSVRLCSVSMLSLTLSAPVLLPATGLAQTAPTSATEAGSGDGVLGEIVVTARKREESLQTVPIAVTAFTAASIEERQIDNIIDVAHLTPNVTFDQGAYTSGSTTNLTAFIRGIGQAEFQIATEPGVGIYVDGVYIARSVGALLDIADVSNIQVLRGPQGILFGKNTIGGAVLLTSNKPNRATEMSGEVTLGEDDRVDIKAMGNTPISDSLAVRLAVSSRSQNGYLDNLATGDTQGNVKRQGARASLLWDGEDKGTLILSADYSHVREQQQPQTLLAVNTAGPLVAFYNNFIAGGVCAGPTPADAPNCYTSQWITGDKTSNYAGGGPNLSNLDAFGLTANYEVPLDELTFRSITGYRDTDNYMTFDADGAPFEMISVEERIESWQASQEFQLLGTAFNERVNWIGGAYYLQEEGTDESPVYVSLASFSNNVRLVSRSYAAFGQVNWDITDQLNLSLGGRYSKEVKRFSPDSFIEQDNTGGSLVALSQLLIPDPALNPDGRRLVPLEEKRAESTEFDPAVTFSYKWTPEVFTYVTYSRGFKGGGFTQKVFPTQATVPSFGPEKVKNYETGLRLSLLERRLSVGLTGFRADYDDLQIILRNGIAPTIQNAGKARIQGAEFEGNAAVLPRVHLFGSVGYLDAKYLELSALTGLDLDNQFANAPEWTAVVGGDFDLVKTREFETTFRMDASYRSDDYKDPTNGPGSLQPAFWLLNASLTFTGPGKPWSVTVGGENLTDRRYLLSVTTQLNGTGNVLASYARGRSVFARFNYAISQ